MNSGQRLNYIDALRAIAALLVLWMHVTEVYWNLSPVTAAGQGLYQIAANLGFGRIGVILFFAISGFVVPFSIRGNDFISIREFLINRFFRIYPTYWVSIPLAVLTSYWAWGRPFSAKDFLINLTLLQDIFRIPPAEGLYWTLLVEIVFYICCVGLALSNSLYNFKRIALVSSALAIFYGFSALFGKLTHSTVTIPFSLWGIHLSIMFLGTLYRGYRDGLITTEKTRLLMYGLFFFYMVFCPLAAVFFIGLEFNYTLSDAIAILIFLMGTGIIRLSNRPMAWLGKISYSIYLFHPIVFYGLLWCLHQTDPTSGWRTQHLGVYLAVNMGITILIAAMVYSAVEKPAIALGKCIARARIPQTLRPALLVSKILKLSPRHTNDLQ